jgi:hypothetical protein
MRAEPGVGLAGGPLPSAAALEVRQFVIEYFADVLGQR